jgi:hypothetical protein
MRLIFGIENTIFKLLQNGQFIKIKWKNKYYIQQFTNDLQHREKRSFNHIN